ncbi:MAG: ATP-binding protein [Calditrichaeota bacterium]|nr:ATP-binding protein [Calditrichota bacterium]
MDKNALFETLVRWNYWGDKLLPVLEQRNLLTTILRNSTGHLPVVISGARRSGKSSLLLLLMKNLLDSGVDRSQFLYLNFEEPQFTTHLSPLFLDQLVTIYRERINPDKNIYFFLDEIQSLPDWQRWVRREADLKEHRIFLTGSSAKLLSGEIATLLTGRYLEYQLFPLSFQEILKWNRISYQTEVDWTVNKALIRNKLLEYLEWGGFPETVLTGDEEKRKKLLQQYLNDILYRDIVYRYQIRDVRLLEAIAYFYITNISAPHSYNRIRNIFDTSIDNIRRYSAYLEESFLLLMLNRFSFKVSIQQKSNRKVYVIDHGLRNQFGFRFSRDLGKLAENIVAVALYQKGDNLFYHVNEGECDFIVQREHDFSPFQVCMGNLEQEDVRRRELKGLLAAMQHLGKTEGTILTDDLEEMYKVDHRTIHFIPLWKFLIRNE